MPESMRWVGLDVHAAESTLAVFDQGTGEVQTRRIRGRPAGAAGACAGGRAALPRRLRGRADRLRALSERLTPRGSGSTSARPGAPTADPGTG
jgi:hypothetical protein